MDKMPQVIDSTQLGGFVPRLARAQTVPWTLLTYVSHGGATWRGTQEGFIGCHACKAELLSTNNSSLKVLSRTYFNIACLNTLHRYSLVVDGANKTPKLSILNSAAAGKRVKGTQISRPFCYGTTARPFDPVSNPKPAGVPDDHTHSWEVYVRGIDGADITYWLRRVQFKLHESIPNHVRMIEGVQGQPFVVKETGWGEFEISIKLYFAAESNEKPQTLYHHLRLHPYGKTDQEKEATGKNNEVISWCYEDLLFNEPYEAFYETLTSGARPKGTPAPAPTHTTGKSKGKGASSSTPANTYKIPEKHLPQQVLERTALIPIKSSPKSPFSREAEQQDLNRINDACAEVQKMQKVLSAELKEKEERLKKLKAENAA
ncbi:putative yeats family protein [Zalerion maritima]|uniref:Protein AF-9 homolog n=1 Tax=Zalerion maritima TaxID=339359 RepID=A0AAD5RK77_9PEZI|nr:putative yeats family protein [Zalerion maritima]